MSNDLDTSARYLDLDSALLAKEPIRAKVNGKEYMFQGDLPAEVVMGYLKTLTVSGTLPMDQAESFFSDLVGRENYEDMKANGLTFPQLEYLSTWLLKEYGVTPESEEEDEGGSPNDGTK